MEVLVSMLILGIGLLGMAGLQMVGLRNNQMAYLRSQATQLAYDMSDRMRANATALASYTGLGTTDNCVTSTCSVTQMAGYDVKQWKDTVAAQLPGGAGTVTSAGGIYSITVSWTEKDASGDVTQSFVTSLQP
jgi:type IV pilus assembly protein PilV